MIILLVAGIEWLFSIEYRKIKERKRKRNSAKRDSEVSLGLFYLISVNK